MGAAVMLLVAVGCGADEALMADGVCDEPTRCGAPQPVDLPADVDLAGESFAYVFVDGERLYRSSDVGTTLVFRIDGATLEPLPEETLDIGTVAHGHGGVLLVGAQLHDAADGSSIATLPEALERVTMRLSSGPTLVGLHELDRTLARGTLSGREVVDVASIDLPADLCGVPSGCVEALLDVSATHAVLSSTAPGGGVEQVVVFELSDVDAPVVLAGGFDAVALGPEHLYGALDGDLRVLELATGEVVGELPDADVRFALSWGEGALVGTTTGGLRTFDLSDPVAPASGCALDLDGSLYGRVIQQLVWFAARPEGMESLDLRCSG